MCHSFSLIYAGSGWATENTLAGGPWRIPQSSFAFLHTYGQSFSLPRGYACTQVMEVDIFYLRLVI